MINPPIYYACACRTGSEFAIAADLEDKTGAWAWVAKQGRTIRPQGVKVPIFSTRALWPGWIFARMDALQFAESRHVRHLYAAKLALHPIEAEQLLQAREAVDAAYAEAQRVHEARSRAGVAVEYKPGEELELITGEFAGRMVAFAGVAERYGKIPGLTVRFTMFGAEREIEVEPQMVRKAG